jgi:hypothetical protein
MRLAHGSDLKVKLGIYYPMLRRLKYWQG